MLKSLPVRVGLALATLATVLAGTTQPAAADGVSTKAVRNCVVVAGSCNTLPVDATLGFVYFNAHTVSYPCNYRIRDVINWNVVRSGRFIFSIAGRVTGLTHSYRLELYDCVTGSYGEITNGPVL